MQKKNYTKTLNFTCWMYNKQRAKKKQTELNIVTANNIPEILIVNDSLHLTSKLDWSTHVSNTARMKSSNMFKRG